MPRSTLNKALRGKTICITESFFLWLPHTPEECRRYFINSLPDTPYGVSGFFAALQAYFPNRKNIEHLLAMQHYRVSDEAKELQIQ